VSLGGRPRKDRKPARCEPMDSLARAARYQAANGILPAGVTLLLTDDFPAGLTGPQRRRWRHKNNHAAARAR
jgi:hypothetical protein